MSLVEVQTYVEQAAKLLGLSLPESVEPQVVENFVRVVAIAQPVLEFELPDTLESAPRFEP
ncbi:DUF4089 domain-containing protein [Leptolyngbya iicbica LK]|uniref:DUF4089 domain-containing protein n=3 Tax=Cyanophyceae TaxID=3028117 RepID=A0A4Q7E2R4_9CYAN|nr:DUF4089 domain-containing protein [Leptolyngbya sp. LK]